MSRTSPSARAERTGRGRRVGAEALLEAGVELLGSPTLSDLLSFVGIRAVAAQADVGPGTVTYHFPAGPSDGRRPNSGLTAAVARHALFQKGLPVPARTAEVLLGEVDNLRNGDLAALRRLARASADDILRFDVPQVENSYTAFYACLAAAPHDPAAAQLLREFHASFEQQFVTGVDLLADVTGRRFIEEFDARVYTTVLAAVTAGFLQRRRFAPEEAPTELLANVALRIFQAVTTDADTGDDTLVPEEMLRLPTGCPLDRAERQRIAAAIRALYAEGNDWDAVTVAAAADRAGVSRATLAAHFPGRGALAAVVLGGFLPELQDAVERDRRLPLVQILWRHVLRLVELARAHRDLTTEFQTAALRAALERGAPDWGDPYDPRTLAPLPQLLVRVLYDHHDELRPEATATDEAALSFSSFVVEVSLHGALARPASSSADLADALAVLLLDGARKARPSVGGEPVDRARPPSS